MHCNQGQETACKCCHCDCGRSKLDKQGFPLLNMYCNDGWIGAATGAVGGSCKLAGRMPFDVSVCNSECQWTVLGMHLRSETSGRAAPRQTPLHEQINSHFCTATGAIAAERALSVAQQWKEQQIDIGLHIDMCAYLMMSTRPVKGVLSFRGTLNVRKSKEPMRPGNWREAAMPVPSMPGM